MSVNFNNKNRKRTSYLTPDLLQLLIDCPCAVDNCENRQDHWSIEHICQSCGEKGHSDYECANLGERKAMRYIIKLQMKIVARYYEQIYGPYWRDIEISSSRSSSPDSAIQSESSTSFGNENTPLLERMA